MVRLTIFPSSTGFTSTNPQNPFIYTSTYTDPTGVLKNCYSYLFNVKISNLTLTCIHLFGDTVNQDPTILRNVYIFKLRKPCN